jgi:DNA-3-methyladenine glycosylase
LRRLRRKELPNDTEMLARFLIGASIVRDSPEGRAVARIVETEAYLPGDAAAHSFRGRTARNRTLFERRGHAYVYYIYGNHYCFNVSAEAAGVGAGVLIRAAEPLLGLDVMRVRRGGARDRDLLRGPGRLASALAITRDDDGLDLCAAGPLWLAAPLGPRAEIATSRRIGLSKEVDRLLRFYETGNVHVSGPKSVG